MEEQKMKAISQGDNTYDIFDDSLRVYEKLPAQSYVVRFSDRRGFYLSKYVDMEITEEKVYGVHEAKIPKVMNSFAEMNRSLGVILSGDKGIGKSLFANMLSCAAMEQGLPVIVVDTYYSGIASYIESIEQEALILFDEFDKTFGDVRARDGESKPQTALLSLFDGLSGGKKLFVITCNNLHSLSDYLLNRPGRFHYHMRFEYPSVSEIRMYLQDKLSEEYYGEIDSVIAFSSKVNLNYDCLRAITFELNHGLTFKEAIQDLNILNMNNRNYKLTLKFENGFVATGIESLDLFDPDLEVVDMYNNRDDYLFEIEFFKKDAMFDMSISEYVVPGDKVKIKYPTKHASDEAKQQAEATKTLKVEKLIISRVKSRGIHYSV